MNMNAWNVIINMI